MTPASSAPLADAKEVKDWRSCTWAKKNPMLYLYVCLSYLQLSGMPIRQESTVCSLCGLGWQGVQDGDNSHVSFAVKTYIYIYIELNVCLTLAPSLGSPPSNISIINGLICNI